MQQLLSLPSIITVAVIAAIFLYWLHAFIILYHFIRFGVGSRPKQAALLFFCGSLLLFVFLGLAAMPIAFTPR